jgi:hypothetical protein
MHENKKHKMLYGDQWNKNIEDAYKGLEFKMIGWRGENEAIEGEEIYLAFLGVNAKQWKIPMTLISQHCATFSL